MEKKNRFEKLYLKGYDIYMLISEKTDISLEDCFEVIKEYENFLEIKTIRKDFFKNIIIKLISEQFKKNKKINQDDLKNKLIKILINDNFDSAIKQLQDDGFIFNPKNLVLEKL